MTGFHLLLLAFGAVYVFANQVWAWRQPHFQPREAQITLRIGNGPP